MDDPVVWVCPVCGDVRIQENPSTAVPTTICGPHYDEMSLEYFVKMSKYVRKEKESEPAKEGNESQS